MDQFNYFRFVTKYLIEYRVTGNDKASDLSSLYYFSLNLLFRHVFWETFTDKHWSRLTEINSSVLFFFFTIELVLRNHFSLRYLCFATVFVFSVRSSGIRTELGFLTLAFLLNLLFTFKVIRIQLSSFKCYIRSHFFLPIDIFSVLWVCSLSIIFHAINIVYILTFYIPCCFTQISSYYFLPYYLYLKKKCVIFKQRNWLSEMNISEFHRWW